MLAAARLASDLAGTAVIELRVTPGIGAASSLTAIKLLATEYPGDHQLALIVPTAGGERRLELGPTWGYSGSVGCLWGLAAFGKVSVV